MELKFKTSSKHFRANYEVRMPNQQFEASNASVWFASAASTSVDAFSVNDELRDHDFFLSPNDVKLGTWFLIEGKPRKLKKYEQDRVRVSFLFHLNGYQELSPTKWGSLAKTMPENTSIVYHILNEHVQTPAISERCKHDESLQFSLQEPSPTLFFWMRCNTKSVLC